MAGLAVSVTGYAAQDGESEKPALRRLTVLRADDSDIQLDGELLDDVWQRALPASGFVQREPDDGSPATERTEIRVLYSADALYVGARAYDLEPDGVRAELARRDQSSRSDEIIVYFDSYHDRRTAFAFGVTPAGSIRDVYHFNDSRYDSDESWDPVWQVKTSVDSLGWVAEFRIPLTQLRFGGESSTWGFQVYRRIERKAEDAYWSPYSKEASGFTSHFGVLGGFEELSQPMRLEVRPYTVVTERRRPESTGVLFAPGQETELDAGFDLQYGLTSDFTLDLTVNPDFGQVEADPAVVNLSAFETFFPEKRPFFVEGSGLFDRDVPAGQMFYSRRIGRSPQGFARPPQGGTAEDPEASTILTATKVTGKTSGGTGIGVLSAVTAEEEATLRDSMGAVTGEAPVEPLTHYFVGRFEQDLHGGSHTVGAMATAVNRKLTGNLDFLRSAAYVVEADGRHRWRNNTYTVRWQFAASHIRGSERAILRAQRSPFRYYQRPDADHVEIDSTRTSLSGYAFNVRAGKTAGTWQYEGGYERVSPGFDVTDLGFQWFGDAQWAYLSGQYLQARPRWIFRDYELSMNANRWWETSGELVSTWFRPILLDARFRNNWSVVLNPIAFGWEHRSTTKLRGGPAFNSDNWHNSFFNLTTDTRKPLALDVWGFVGGNFGTPGAWWGVEPSLVIRPSGALSARVGVDYSWDRDPTQWVTNAVALDSTRHILAEIDQQTLGLTTRLDWALTPVLSVQFYGQPFVSAGRYDTFKEVTRPRADRFEDRFRFYGDELSCEDDPEAEDPACEVDLDGSGAADFTFPLPDFNSRQFRSTMVVRWEYRPGSVVFFAWQHGRDRFVPDGRFDGFSDMIDMFDEEADNAFVVKLNYWLSF